MYCEAQRYSFMEVKSLQGTRQPPKVRIIGYVKIRCKALNLPQGGGRVALMMWQSRLGVSLNVLT